MAFNFENNGLIVTDIYDPGTFTRSHQDTWTTCWETTQEWLGVFVCAVLRPHDAEYTDFRVVWLAAHELTDQLILAVRHAHLCVKFMFCDLFCCWFLSG
ncbi:hypothetical protein D3C74_362770 [compost metagenome]